jgi:hypothetical protein
VCCDVYGNAGGDWVGCIAGQDSINGNMCKDPFFCDADNGDFTLAANSPCLPDNNSCSELIGAYGLGCDAILPIPTISLWGMIVLTLALLSAGVGAFRIMKRRSADQNA